MKKLILTVALIGSVACSYAQGLVNTANSGNLISWTPNGGAAVALPGSSSAATTFRFALLYGPQALTFTPYAGGNVQTYLDSLGAYSVAPVLGVNHATAAGRVVFPAELNIPGIAGGTVASLLMVGWQDTGGLTTFASALQSPYFGTSTDVELQLGGGTTPTPNFFGVLRTSPDLQSAGFTLAQAPVVPEPTSFALAGIGAAALLIFRRRN